jgi:hypothetical protein
MGLRITSSIVSVLCAWVLWEKWISHNPGQPTARLVQAMQETKTLAECRTAMQEAANQRATKFRNTYKDPKWDVLSSEYSTAVYEKGKGGAHVTQEYAFYCLPPTVDPYHDSR